MAFPEYLSDTDLKVTPFTNYIFVTIDEIQAELSAKGERLHTDDINPANDNYDDTISATVNRTSYIAQLCQRITSDMMSYLAPRYRPQDIYQIPRIREIATYWACYKLTKRRGNEPLYEAEYLEGEETLERFRDGSLYLDAPCTPRAYMQSYLIDMRSTYQPTRVIREASTSVIANQRVLQRAAFAWL